MLYGLTFGRAYLQQGICVCDLGGFSPGVGGEGGGGGGGGDYIRNFCGTQTEQEII